MKPSSLRWIAFGALTALLLAAWEPATAQSRVSRQQRIREHEEKIRAIIEERRKQLKEEEDKRKAEEEKAKQAEPKPEDGEAPAEKAPEAPRPVSNVVMGFKFLNEEGVADYHVTVPQGGNFVSELRMFNQDRNPVDRIRLAIGYDKRFMEPVRVFDAELRPSVEGEPTFSRDDARALILYDAPLAKPLNAPEVVLLRILWKARRPTPYTGIEFAFSMLEKDDVPHTAIYVRGKNILGVADDPADGVLSGALMITESDGEEKPLQGKAEELKTLYLGSVASDAAVGLRLVGPAEPPRVGDRFVVKVRLNNPDGALIDALAFALKYDPEVLEIVDEDQFNTISTGINAHDGPYQSHFGWDMHKRNEVRTDIGLVNYQMSLSNGEALPSKTVADVHFRAKRPTAGTELFLVEGKPGQTALTSVRYFGYERLDLAGEASRPAIPVTVLPAPPPTPLEVAAPALPATDSDAYPAAPPTSSIRPLAIERVPPKKSEEAEAQEEK